MQLRQLLRSTFEEAAAKGALAPGPEDGRTTCASTLLSAALLRLVAGDNRAAEELVRAAAELPHDPSLRPLIEGTRLIVDSRKGRFVPASAVFSLPQSGLFLGGEGLSARAPTQDPDPTIELRISNAGTEAQLGDTVYLDLARHHSARRLLMALGRAEGRPLSVDQLLDVGWPGERIRDGAGRARVYVVVLFLRKKLLGHHLLREENGYVLSPNVRAIWVSHIPLPSAARATERVRRREQSGAYAIPTHEGQGPARPVEASRAGEKYRSPL